MGEEEGKKGKKPLMYCRKEKACKLCTERKRIANIKQKTFLACSVDGLVSCSCDGHSQKLVEIKCPCALRQKLPKDAARQRGCQ